MDVSLFDPGREEQAAISLLRRFWRERGEAPFRAHDLVSSREVQSQKESAIRLRTWLGGAHESLVLGELVLEKRGDLWECESLTRGSPRYLAVRILPHVTGASDLIGAVYWVRQRLVHGQSFAALSAELRLYVEEHLSRCGFGEIRSDLRSIAELCDIFEEHEFHAAIRNPRK